jgi:hypothetical protein
MSAIFNGVFPQLAHELLTCRHKFQACANTRHSTVWSRTSAIGVHSQRIRRLRREEKQAISASDLVHRRILTFPLAVQGYHSPRESIA